MPEEGVQAGVPSTMDTNDFVPESAASKVDESQSEEPSYDGLTGVPAIDRLSQAEARRKNPLVLVGAALTAGVLTRGIFAFRQGNSALSARMMNWRIYGQGATVGLMVASLFGFGGTDSMLKLGLIKPSAASAKHA